MYSKKRIGPSTDPCGTPHVIKAGAEVCLGVLAVWMLGPKIDVTHLDYRLWLQLCLVY